MKMPEEMTLKELEEHYDNWAETYDKDADDWSYKAHDKIVHRLWKNDIYLLEKRVIDLACGPGRHAIRYFLPSGFKVGVDISRKMLKEAKFWTYQPVQADIKRVPFKDSSFDASMCVTALEHFPDIRPYLKEMKRIVKTNGTIIFTVPCTQIEGLYRTSKGKLERMLRECRIETIDMFKFLSHYQEREYPVFVWATIGKNTK
jgi:ubiquinone/menaquinone biosynthesis C-methylase UbiE